MTRKDFEVVAKVVACCKIRPRIDIPSIDSVLKQANPKYNKDRFWKAVKKYGGLF